MRFPREVDIRRRGGHEGSVPVKARLPFERKQHNRENKRLRRMGGAVYRRKTPPKEGGDIVEGRNPVIEALRAGRTIKRILLANGVGQSAAVEKIFRLARERGMTVERVERREVERLSVTGKSQGVLAVAGPKGYVGLKRLLEIGPERGEATLLVVLDGIQDPHNLGAIIRTADAAGVHGLVIPERRSASLSAGVATGLGGSGGTHGGGSSAEPGQRAGTAKKAKRLDGGRRPQGDGGLRRGGLQAAYSPRNRR